MLAIQACEPESHPQNLCRSLDKTRADTSSAETIERDKLNPMRSSSLVRDWISKNNMNGFYGMHLKLAFDLSMCAHKDIHTHVHQHT